MAAATRHEEELEAERERSDRAMARAESAQSKIKEAADESIQTAVVVGTALAGGYAQGRYGHKQEVFGMPGVMAVGAGAVGCVAFGVGGRKYRKYLVSVAQGGFACSAALYGLEAGQEDAEENVSGVGARRGRRGFRGRSDPNDIAIRDAGTDIPANLPPGLRSLYTRRRNAERSGR